MQKDWVVFVKWQPPLSSVASTENVAGPIVGDAVVLRIWREWLPEPFGKRIAINFQLCDL